MSEVLKKQLNRRFDPPARGGYSFPLAVKRTIEAEQH
jgi:hypothetical protein